ncbi:putative ripening-related protein 6-like [Hibiscus syriacus]|uniref:Ripening-related protein 6-like n=1 Tax=Hibiscus syriacus TaxID=106335 RepID=A0A6A3CIB1_HIBSY|nr:putative ripening-related protein 6-like [Hibiscus syriacus]
MKLYKLAIRLPDESTPPEIINNSRFYPYFKDCVGALDGTHIRASVPPNIQGRFRSRKGETTQNVLAAIKFDLKFSYVIAGWEGSAHDSRILTDALTRPRGFSIPEGKYYLADAGYGIRNGIISPYRGVRYHLKEFSNHRPENAKELFNLRHSSLRTTVERVFGILKKHFRVLDAEPFWDFQTKIDVVLACTIIHNHIMGVDPNDIINEGMYEEPEPYSITSMLTQREEREEAREWASGQNQWNVISWKYLQRRHKKEHPKYGQFLNKKIDSYDEMALVVSQDMATRSFARTFADIDLDDINEGSIPLNFDTQHVDEERANISSSGTSKCKRKNVQENVEHDHIQFVGEKLGEIAEALKKFTEDRTPYLYEEVMSIEKEGFGDDFLCEVFDFLAKNELEAKAFLAKKTKHRKIWLQKFTQG